MAKSFDNLLGSLHSQVSDTAVAPYNTNILEVDEKRQIRPIEFDTVIAFEGDVNSQVITIKMPLYADNHDLSGCQKKVIRWKNLSSGIEGNSDLNIIEDSVTENNFCVTWEVPSDICTQEGNVEISIRCWDLSDDRIVYSWNTPSYTGLSIGKTMSSVGFLFPAKDEILIIDKETKNILAPSGYNNVICNYGEVGVSIIYLMVSRYLGRKNDLDVLNSEATIEISLNGQSMNYLLDRQSVNIYVDKVSDESREGMVIITWEVPEDITENEFGYIGKFDIALSFKSNGKKWRSGVYKNLSIGAGMGVPVTPEVITTTELIQGMIRDYFNTNTIIFKAPSPSLPEETVEE